MTVDTLPVAFGEKAVADQAGEEALRCDALEDLVGVEGLDLEVECDDELLT